jgi:hypothetical protein
MLLGASLRPRERLPIDASAVGAPRFLPIGAATGNGRRLSNKMTKLLPLRGWTIERFVETHRKPARTEPMVDQSIRPR